MIPNIYLSDEQKKLLANKYMYYVSPASAIEGASTIAAENAVKQVVEYLEQYSGKQDRGGLFQPMISILLTEIEWQALKKLAGLDN